jgi:hypothetical protein
VTAQNLDSIAQPDASPTLNSCRSDSTPYRPPFNISTTKAFFSPIISLTIDVDITQACQRFPARIMSSHEEDAQPRVDVNTASVASTSKPQFAQTENDTHQYYQTLITDNRNQQCRPPTPLRQAFSPASQPSFAWWSRSMSFAQSSTTSTHREKFRNSYAITNQRGACRCLAAGRGYGVHSFVPDHLRTIAALSTGRQGLLNGCQDVCRGPLRRAPFLHATSLPQGSG